MKWLDNKIDKIFYKLFSESKINIFNIGFSFAKSEFKFVELEMIKELKIASRLKTNFFIIILYDEIKRWNNPPMII